MRRIALLLLLATPALAGGGQARFGVVIGADRGEPGEARLRYAEDDAARFADVLTRFGQVPDENLVLLRGRSAARVQAALAGLGARVQAAAAGGTETVLFVYYSGHADAEALHLGSTPLRLEALKAAVTATGAQVSVLVVDACRSGALTRVKGAAPAQPFEIAAEDRLANEGSAIITSSAAGEDAQESDILRGGIFSHHFVVGLLGAADASGDKQVSLSEAYRYAYQETLRTTSRARFVQHPTYDLQMRGREDLVVTRLADGAGLGRVRFEAEGGWILLPQGHGEVVELSTTPGAEVLVQPGSYVVRRRTEEAVFEGSTTVPAGGVRVLRAVDLPRVPYGLTVRKGLSTERRRAWSVLTAFEVAGPTRPGLSATARGALGGRLDLESLSLELRLTYAYAEADNESLSLTQHGIGLDLTALKLFDFGPLAAGFGLRLGGEAAQQSFDTDGEAPDRRALVGRIGPALRVEYAPVAWLGLALSGGLDGLVLRDADADLTLDTVPWAGLGATVYVP